MTRRLEVSEKTLELNLSAEILVALRVKPGLSRAYMVGMTQAQERLSGVDASLASHGRVFGAIQFKAPHAPTKKKEHVFTLPAPQLACLHQLASRLRGRVTYALPCVSRWDELVTRSPHILPVTINLGVVGLTSGTHRVVVTSSKVTVASDPVEVERVHLEHQLDDWAVEFHNEGEDGAPSGLDVIEWLGELAELEREDSRIRQRQQLDRRAQGQALRGLALVAVPEGETGLEQDVDPRAVKV